MYGRTPSCPVEDLLHRVAEAEVRRFLGAQPVLRERQRNLLGTHRRCPRHTTRDHPSNKALPDSGSAECRQRGFLADPRNERSRRIDGVQHERRHASREVHRPRVLRGVARDHALALHFLGFLAPNDLA